MTGKNPPGLGPTQDRALTRDIHVPMTGKAQACGGSPKTGTVYLHHSWEGYGVYKIKKGEMSGAILGKTRLFVKQDVFAKLASCAVC